MQKETYKHKENYCHDSLKKFWALMSVKFPNKGIGWIDTFGALPYFTDKDDVDKEQVGKLTPQGREWENMLECLTNDEIAEGIMSLKNFFNDGFVPSALQFYGMCRQIKKTAILEHIRRFLEGSDKYFTNQPAYNVYHNCDKYYLRTRGYKDVNSHINNVMSRMKSSDFTKLEIPKSITNE